MLEALRLEPMAAAVAAWHNRLPLAQRVLPAQVQSLGYVVLPFVADAGRGRGALRPAFSEDFLPPWTPQQIARWARRHGRDVACMPAGATRRDVALDPGAMGPDGTLVPLVVRTASIESQGRVQRVLVGAGKRPAVLGRRWRSAGRVGALAGVFALALVVGVLRFAILAHEHLGNEDAPAVALAAAEAASAAAAVDAAASEPEAAEPMPPPEPVLPELAETPEAPEAPASAVAVAASVPVPAAAPASTAAPASAPAAAPPPPPAAAPARVADVEPQWGRIDLPQVRPEIVARKEPSKSVWAIAAPQVRDARAAAKGASRMQQQLAAAGQPGLRVETMAVGHEWRVVGWPFRSRRAAEEALAVLARQGVKAEVVEF